MYLTVCPLRGPGHDSSVGERMYHTVCPLRGLGHDSSVGEWMYLTVCPLRGLGHDSSVGEWMNHTFCPLSGPGLISSHGGVFQGIYRWLIALCQPILSQCGKKWLNLPSKVSHDLQPPATCSHRGARPKSMHRQTMVEIKNRIMLVTRNIPLAVNTAQ